MTPPKKPFDSPVPPWLVSALQLQVVLHTKGQQQRAVQKLQAVRPLLIVC